MPLFFAGVLAHCAAPSHEFGVFSHNLVPSKFMILKFMILYDACLLFNVVVCVCVGQYDHIYICTDVYVFMT